MKQRYATTEVPLLGQAYSGLDVLIRATHERRTIEFANAVQTGMYEPLENGLSLNANQTSIMPLFNVSQTVIDQAASLYGARSSPYNQYFFPIRVSDPRYDKFEPPASCPRVKTG